MSSSSARVETLQVVFRRYYFWILKKVLILLFLDIHNSQPRYTIVFLLLGGESTTPINNLLFFMIEIGQINNLRWINLLLWLINWARVHSVAGFKIFNFWFNLAIDLHTIILINPLVFWIHMLEVECILYSLLIFQKIGNLGWLSPWSTLSLHLMCWLSASLRLN